MPNKFVGYLKTGILYAVGVLVLSGLLNMLYGQFAVIQAITNFGFWGLTVSSIVTFTILTWVVDWVKKTVAFFRD